jgi:hypothetical protein
MVGIVGAIKGATSGVAAPTPVIDSCDARLCQAGGDPACATLSGCANTGEQHRVGWETTDCSDPSHHIAIHVSVDGGGYVETADNLSCTQADPDAGCCDWIGKSPYAPEGEYMFIKHFSSDLGACTTTYQYRVRVETDGTDTLLGSACTDGSALTGCDTTCIG